MSISQIAGQIGMGYLSDHYDAHIPLFFSPFFSALSIFILWGFSKSLGTLLVFSILYGVFAGGYSVLYCRFATSLTSQRATGLWLYSIFEFQRGAGNIIGGTVSGLVIKGPVDATGYGMGKYEGVVLLAGGSLLISSLGSFGWFFRGQCLKFAYIFEKIYLTAN
jgi:sugar phosphate permease